jgi:hypothetical protein
MGIEFNTKESSMSTALAVQTRSKWLEHAYRLHHWLEYRAFLKSQGVNNRITSPGERRLNEQFNDGPSNHRYAVRGGSLIPSFQLHERWRHVDATLPERPETFIDIGCCYGYYVLETARRPGCNLAVGVDVHRPFLSAAEKAGILLRLPNVAFHRAYLDEIAADPARYGGPFEVASVLGTYHYIFWGSTRSDHALRSHERILSCLSEITTGYVLLSARLELHHLPRTVKTWAYASPEADTYNAKSFLRAAESIFDVRQVGLMGSYPLFLMRKRGSGLNGSAGVAYNEGVSVGCGI